MSYLLFYGRKSRIAEIARNTGAATSAVSKMVNKSINKSLLQKHPSVSGIITTFAFFALI